MRSHNKDVRTAVLYTLESGNVISAMANVHVKGMYSLVFRERANEHSGMLRMFYIPEGHNPMNWIWHDGDFGLLPHNHRQEILLIGLFGHVINVRMEHQEVQDVAPSFTVYEYDFGSAFLNGNFPLEPKAGLKYLSWKMENMNTEPGSEAIIMKADEIHTVIASGPSAWLVFEGKASDKPAICYSNKKDLRLNFDCLYKKLSADEIATLCKEITEKAREYHADHE